MTRAPTLFLGAILVASLACCGKSGGSSGSGKSKTATPGGAGSPEAAFKLQYQLMRAEQFDKLYDLYAKASRQVMVDMAKNMRKMPVSRFKEQFGFDPKELQGLKSREIFMKLSRARIERITPEKKKELFTTPKITRVDRESKDRVMVRFERGGAQCRQRFRLEDGGWRIHGFPACKKESRKPGPPPKKTGTQP